MLGFDNVVRQILSSCSGLQYAIDQRSGGSQTKEKADWLCEVLVQFFRDNADLEAYEVEEWVSQILWNEFNLSIEDGTVLCTAQLLCQAFEYCKKSDEANLNELVAKLPTSQNQIARAVNEDETSDSDNEEEIRVENNYLGNNTQQEIKNETNDISMGMQPQPMEVEEGWTVVRKK